MRVTALAALLFLLPAAASAGPRPCLDVAWIASVDVQGLVDAPESDARTAIAATVTTNGSPILFPMAQLALIESAVLDTGWFDSVTAVWVPTEDGRCVLRVRVREFLPVEAIRFHDLRAYPGDVLLPLLETQPGKKPNRKTLAEDGERLAEKYHEDGYEAARFLSADVDGASVAFHLSEGRIARVEVIGAPRTRPKRVRKVLGLRSGDLYNSRALVDGQAALYRTGLFSLVGFGVEPVTDEDAESLVLTVTVGELTAPYSRTEVFTDRDASWTTVEARLRNVGAGHSARVNLGIFGVSPPDLAEEGFDEYYVATGTAELRLFRPDPGSPGARLALEGERVHGRVRADLGIRQHMDLPSARATGDIPVTSARDWQGLGTITGAIGWRNVEAEPLAGGPMEEDRGAWGHGEVGLVLAKLSGIDTPAELEAHAGVEIHSGWRPFSYLAAEGRARVAIWRGIRLEARADAATLTGREIPWFRETALSGTPLGFGRDYGFARNHARGEIAAVLSAPRELFGISAGWQGAAWSGANDSRGTNDAQAIVVEARAGPDFARLRAGVAAPLPGATARELWWFAGLIVATPY